MENRIFQFEDLARTVKRVMKTARRNGLEPGQYVTLHIRNVPLEFMGVLNGLARRGPFSFA